MKTYTDTEQRIWVKIYSLDPTSFSLVLSLTKWPVTYKRLALSLRDLQDVLFFSMESEDGTIHTLNLHSTSTNELPETGASFISSGFKKWVEHFIGPRK